MAFVLDRARKERRHHLPIGVKPSRNSPFNPMRRGDRPLSIARACAAEAKGVRERKHVRAIEPAIVDTPPDVYDNTLLDDRLDSVCFALDQLSVCPFCRAVSCSCFLWSAHAVPLSPSRTIDPIDQFDELDWCNAQKNEASC